MSLRTGFDSAFWLKSKQLVKFFARGRRKSSGLRVGFVSVLLSASAAMNLAYAAAPTLDYVFPVAWQQGESNAVTFGGKLEPWPVKVWSDCSGVNFVAETNSGKLSVQIAKDAPLGPHLVRVFNQDGASLPRIFIIAPEKDKEEKEPNDALKEAQSIESLPVTIGGRLEKGGEVDSFAVRVEAGKWLVARVDAYSLGSPLDATLHLFGEHGVRLAFNHDGPQNIDPLLAYRVEKSGTYIVQVAGFAHPPEANVCYAGSAATIYRLTITDGPLAYNVFPTGVQRGHKAQLRFLGWNLEKDGQVREQPFDASSLAADANEAFVSAPDLQAHLSVIVGDEPEQIEIEPDNKSNEPQSVSPPCAISGRIDPPRDEDRFRFNVKKGDRFEFRVASAALGLPLDAVLKIEDATGKMLAEDDDGGGAPDARLVWTAPADGLYAASVSDRFRRGGNEFVYRLIIAPPIPDFKVGVASNIFSFEPGKTNEVKLDITRLNDHTNALRIAFETLPAGITVQPMEVPATSGEVKVNFVSDSNIQPTNQPLRILVQPTDNSLPQWRPALFDLRTKDPRGNILITQTDQLWLTVIPKPEPAAKVEEKKH